MKKILIAFTVLAAFSAASVTLAQSTNARDDTELLVSQIQTDSRAVVLAAMKMTDAEVRAFTPIYDKYQAENKKLFAKMKDLIDKFAANYGSMTDDAAKDIMKDSFKLREERTAVLKKYAKQMNQALPPAKALQWVQIENKLNALLDAQAAVVIPLSR